MNIASLFTYFKAVPLYFYWTAVYTAPWTCAVPLWVVCGAHGAGLRLLYVFEGFASMCNEVLMLSLNVTFLGGMLQSIAQSRCPARGISRRTGFASSDFDSHIDDTF